MYAPVTLGQPTSALAPVAIASTAPDGSETLAPTELSIDRRRLNVLEGQRVTVTGRLSGRSRAGLPERIVVLQTLAGRGWTTLARARTGAKGRFRLGYLPRQIGTRAVRLLFKGDSADEASHRRLGRLGVYRLAGASWYGGGGSLACGGSLTSSTLGVANKTLPCGTLVTLRYGARTIRVPVIDRGPYVEGREFDLTEATRAALGFGDTGQVWASR